MPTVIWRLRGHTGNVIDGRIDRPPSRSYIMTVVLGSEIFLEETYPDEASAVMRATQVRDGLLKAGGWRLVSDATGEDLMASPLRKFS